MAAKAPSRLALVKNAPLREQTAAVLEVDALSPADLALAEKHAAASGVSGVLVGALRGAAPWDVRPLLLVHGELSLVRLTDPGLVLKRERYRQVTSLLSRVTSEGLSAALRSWGQHGGQIWVQRPFYDTTLAVPSTLTGDPAVFTDPDVAFQAAEELLQTVHRLHALGLVHGHLSPHNVAILDGVPLLLDFGFQVAGSARAEFGAPEYAEGVRTAPHAKQDIYGLGLALEALLAQECPAELRRLISAMKSSNPTLRPNLSQVVEVFRHLKRRKPAMPVEPAPLQPPPQVQAKVPDRTIPRAVVEEVRSAHEAAKPQPSSRSLVPLALTALVVGITAVGVHLWQDRERIEFDPSLRSAASVRSVAEAALAGDEDARLLLTTAAREGKAPDAIRAGLLRVAFHPAWERDLSAADIDAVFQLSVSSVIPDAVQGLVPLDQLHPGVALALASELPLGKLSRGLSALPVAHFSTLAAPYGGLFSELEKLQVTTLGEPAAHALAHIVGGDLRPEVIEVFLVVDPARKLRLLAPLVPLFPGLDERLYNAIRTSERFAPQIRWFEEDESVGWMTSAAAQRLSVMMGDLQGLPLQQLVDLLRSPLKPLRAEAVRQLAERYPSEKGALTYLASAISALSRFQTVSLVAALAQTGEAQFSFVQSWFESGPEPDDVLGLLLARANVKELDPFNVEAARYLNLQTIKLSRKQIEQLVTHPEPLARALAYSQLRLTEPSDRKLLESMAQVEPSARLRGELMQRLADPVISNP